MSLTFLLGLLGAAIVLVRRRPLVSFGILFFFLGHAVESTTLPLELAFEHRNYLPSLGLLIAVADLLEAEMRLLGIGRRYAAYAVIGALAVLTWIRADAWANPAGIFTTALEANPESQRARAALAQLLTNARRPADARRLLAASNTLAATLQLGYLDCLQTGKLRGARLGDARHAVASFVSDTETGLLIELANLDLSHRCQVDTQGLLAVTESAAKVPRMSVIGRQKLWMYVAHLRHELQDQEGATSALESAYSVFPTNPTPLALAANWALDAGESTAACDLYRRAYKASLGTAVNLSEKLEEIKVRIAQLPEACDTQ